MSLLLRQPLATGPELVEGLKDAKSHHQLTRQRPVLIS